jgi:hypothetical protein
MANLMSNATMKRLEFFLKTVRYFCPILRKFEVFRQILIKVRVSKVTSSSSVGAALIRPDGRTDITKPISAFNDQANTPKND